MGRIKEKCRIEGCTGMGASRGNQGGRPFYFTVCQFHKKQKNRGKLNPQLVKKNDKSNP